MFDDGHHVAHGDAELVLSQTGGDVGVCVRPDIRIQTEGHTCHFPFGCCQLIDNLQFGNALDVEAENVVVETNIDFPVALADTSVDDFLAVETCTHAGLYFSAADTVNT